MKESKIHFVILLLCLFGLVACRRDEAGPSAATATPPSAPAAPAEENGAGVAAAPPQTATATAVPDPTETPEPTGTPRPPKELVVCLPQAPANLYLYGDTSAAATAVRHGIYENLYTTVAYGYQAQGLTKLPNLADGDAAIRLVEVNEGDLVMNAAGTAVRLGPGVTVIDAAGERVAFSGTPLVMPQLEVDFTFEPLVWSDGTPVTAEDSVYSFTLASDPQTPGGRRGKEVLTAAYVATGPLSVRWTGIPGYLDDTYFTNVWPPLPRHQLEGYTAGQLAEAEEASRHPLSSGPFMVAEWTPDGPITLVKNPYYYRADEGLPYIDTVIFRPGVTATETALMAEGCDVMTQGTLSLALGTALVGAEAEGVLVAHLQPDAVFEHIDFGINSYGLYGDGNNRPDWFEDRRVRQAVTMCTDRQRMEEELMLGRSHVMAAYVPPTHPLYPADLVEWPYDPAAANALLDQVGYIDTDGNGIREDVRAGIPFSITLTTEADHPIRSRVSQIFQENMGSCGIHVALAYVPADQLYADGPLGPLFGRRFDLGGFAWLASIRPACQLWLASNITGPTSEGFGGWGNLNLTGWSDEAYDAACGAALRMVPGMPEYESSHQQALRIFAEELPIIPLFSYLKLAATRPEVMNFKLDTTQPSELWNLYELDVPEP